MSSGSQAAIALFVTKIPKDDTKAIANSVLEDFLPFAFVFSDTATKALF